MDHGGILDDQLFSEGEASGDADADTDNELLQSEGGSQDESGDADADVDAESLQSEECSQDEIEAPDNENDEDEALVDGRSCPEPPSSVLLPPSSFHFSLSLAPAFALPSSPPSSCPSPSPSLSSSPSPSSSWRVLSLPPSTSSSCTLRIPPSIVHLSHRSSHFLFHLSRLNFHVQRSIVHFSL